MKEVRKKKKVVYKKKLNLISLLCALYGISLPDQRVWSLGVVETF